MHGQGKIIPLTHLYVISPTDHMRAEIINLCLMGRTLAFAFLCGKISISIQLIKLEIRRTYIYVPPLEHHSSPSTASRNSNFARSIKKREGEKNFIIAATYELTT